MSGLIQTSIEQGLIFAILGMGIFITNKILNMADLSVEGSFPLGAFIFAKFLLMGLDPIVSTLLAFAFGTLAGLLTAIFFTKFKINSLLSGILTMNILYSLNLRINNRSNIPLGDHKLIFDLGPRLLILIIIVVLVKILLDLFLKTEVGYLLVATGDNESLVKSLGQNSDNYKLLGLMLSNGLIAMSGALMAQFQGYVDAQMGKGTLVIALAAIIIGDTLFRNVSILKSTSRAIIGAIVYKIIGGVAIDLGLPPTDLSAINATIVVVFLLYNNFAIDFINKLKARKGDNYAKNY